MVFRERTRHVAAGHALVDHDIAKGSLAAVFDAIIAGAPVNNQTHLHASQIKKMMDIIADEKRFVPREKIELVSRTVMNKCDAADSVRDGFLSNPQACNFQPEELLCRGSDTANCLTAGQVESLKQAYGDTYTKSGKLVYPGHPRGFELNWRMPAIGSEPPERPLGSFRYFGHQNAPGWTWRNFELDTDLALAVKNADYEALSPDLKAFKARGGKLIIYHGLNDPGPSPLNTVNYYEDVRKTMGSNQSDWLRVFMMPGMDHCRGGVGPDQANFLGAMERWVESGVAPGRIISSRITASGRVDMTRPLCPYPQFAKWNGKGSTNDAENFVCATR
jgi:feruloyl esterase